METLHILLHRTQAIIHLLELLNELPASHAGGDLGFFGYIRRLSTNLTVDRLQVRGFFEQALSRFPTAAVIPPIREWVNDKYVRAQQAGRV